MKINNKWGFAFLIIEVQVILILLIFLVPKVLEVERKVERTNKFLFSLIQDKNTASLQVLKEDDLIIGDLDAPATMFLYTRFNCSACSDFYDSNYEKLKSEYVDKGLLKIVVRYLTHIDSKEAFHAARCAHFAYDNNVFSAYNKLMASEQSDLNLSTIESNIVTLIPDSTKLHHYLTTDNDGQAIFTKAKEAKAAGVSRTPTIIINGQMLIGNRKYKKLKELILAEINA